MVLGVFVLVRNIFGNFVLIKYREIGFFFNIFEVCIFLMCVLLLFNKLEGFVL